MKSRISEILEQIEEKKKKLIKEYQKLKEKYFYELRGRKVVFDKKIRKHNKKFKVGFIRYLLSTTRKDFLSMPFIYGMAIPAFILDVFLFFYQQICFRLYGIPLVKRKDYIIYDRRYLDYLNFGQKFNCLYCSRVNGLFSYAVEIGGRTEQYWCPIKASQKIKGGHNWQKTFADYGDPEGFEKCFNKTKVFEKAEK